MKYVKLAGCITILFHLAGGVYASEEKPKEETVSWISLNGRATDYEGGKFQVIEKNGLTYTQCQIRTEATEIAGLRKEIITGLRDFATKLENPNDKVETYRQIKNADSWPYSPIGRFALEYNNLDGSRSKCIATGALVGPRHVLALAKDIFQEGISSPNDDRKFSDATIHFVPGRLDHKKPFEKISAQGIFLSASYNHQDANSESNYGLIVLNKDIGHKTGWYGILKNGDTLAIDGKSIVGYRECSDQKRMWRSAFPKIAEINKGTLGYLNGATRDQHSSSPVISQLNLQEEEENEYYVTALHWENSAIRLNDSFFEWLKKIKSSDPSGGNPSQYNVAQNDLTFYPSSQMYQIKNDEKYFVIVKEKGSKYKWPFNIKVFPPEKIDKVGYPKHWRITLHFGKRPFSAPKIESLKNAVDEAKYPPALEMTLEGTLQGQHKFKVNWQNPEIDPILLLINYEQNRVKVNPSLLRDSSL